MFYANLIKNNHDLTGLDEFLLFLSILFAESLIGSSGIFTLYRWFGCILLWKYLLDAK